MQVSAHNVVINFGIDALKMFWNLENENEIKQCRQDWQNAHAVKVCLKSFNDGVNCIVDRKGYLVAERYAVKAR